MTKEGVKTRSKTQHYSVSDPTFFKYRNGNGKNPTRLSIISTTAAYMVGKTSTTLPTGLTNLHIYLETVSMNMILVFLMKKLKYNRYSFEFYDCVVVLRSIVLHQDIHIHPIFSCITITIWFEYSESGCYIYIVFFLFKN